MLNEEVQFHLGIIRKAVVVRTGSSRQLRVEAKPVLAALDAYAAGEWPFCLGAFSFYYKHYRTVQNLFSLRLFLRSHLIEWLKNPPEDFYLLKSGEASCSLLEADLKLLIKESADESQDAREKKKPVGPALKSAVEKYSTDLQAYFLRERELPLRWFYHAARLIGGINEVVSALTHIITSGCEDDDWEKWNEIERPYRKEPPFTPRDVTHFLPDGTPDTSLDVLLVKLAEFAPRTRAEESNRYAAMEALSKFLDGDELAPGTFALVSGILTEELAAVAFVSYAMLAVFRLQQSLDAYLNGLRQKVEDQVRRKPKLEKFSRRELLEREDTSAVRAADCYLQYRFNLEHQIPLMPDDISRFAEHISFTRIPRDDYFLVCLQTAQEMSKVIREFPEELYKRAFLRMHTGSS